MSHFTQSVAVEQPVRPPGMRRKSSAQNILSSFKASANQLAPAPITITTASVPSNASYASGVSTPTVMTPSGREWDAQSLQSDTIANSIPGTGSPGLTQGTSVELLRDLMQKRIVALTYLRNIHEGCGHWFHTINISSADLVREFNNNAMKKRSVRFATLGMSLSNLLDINNPQDLLRAILNTLTEYDQTREDSDKSKMRQPKRLFRPGVKKPKLGGIAEYANAYADASGEVSMLMTPHLPFQLDYHQTLVTLIDVISEVYHKLSKLLGPSVFSHGYQQSMVGALGQLTPLPGMSYLFPERNHDSDTRSLYSIATAIPPAMNITSNNAIGSPIPIQNVTEMIVKIDSKLKKMIGTLLKELDAFARHHIKDELASLDPLLRNLNVAEDGGVPAGRTTYEFDGM
ncbi:hypothetical protein FISHEDRAFT_43475 [Fistulina hepatica ATCC 64428]|uniref:Uncharacterized protein n=1 Tax=Fistulina hepatica ATCC 64428 TaxID=1128425 RepID=A0A0D7ABX6_9AGAR|nr:hypothetical protein FISHEDRAFT_43475 [Fistulina hepatica ATCC 64428]